MTPHLATRIERALDSLDIAAAERLCAPGYREHSPLARSGSDLGALIAALPHDFRYSCELSFQEGELMVMIGVCEGLPTSPTSSIDLFRVHDGLLIEHWDAEGKLDEPPYGLPHLRSYEIPRSQGPSRNTEHAVRLLGQDSGAAIVHAERLCGRFGASGYAACDLQPGALRVERTVAEGDYVLLQSTLALAAGTAYDLFEFGPAGAARHWQLTARTPAGSGSEPADPAH